MRGSRVCDLTKWPGMSRNEKRSAVWLVGMAWAAGCGSHRDFQSGHAAGGSDESVLSTLAGSESRAGSAHTAAGGSSPGPSVGVGGGDLSGGASISAGAGTSSGAGGTDVVVAKPPSEFCAGRLAGYRFCNGPAVFECASDSSGAALVETCQNQACVDGACVGESDRG